VGETRKQVIGEKERKGEREIVKGRRRLEVYRKK